ncbi:MAG: hypothetical protein ACSLE6_10545 [Mycobacterium sp.]
MKLTRRMATASVAACGIAAGVALGLAPVALAGGGYDLDGDGYADVSAVAPTTPTVPVQGTAPIVAQTPQEVLDPAEVLPTTPVVNEGETLPEAAPGVIPNAVGDEAPAVVPAEAGAPAPAGAPVPEAPVGGISPEAAPSVIVPTPIVPVPAG